MLSRVLLCTAPLLLGGAAASAPPWDGYLDEGAYVSRLEAIRDEAPGKVRLERYGTSREGRPLFAIVLGQGEGEVDARPTFLVTAGIDALHPAGTEYSVRIAERLLADHAEASMSEALHLLSKVASMTRRTRPVSAQPADARNLNISFAG